MSIDLFMQKLDEYHKELWAQSEVLDKALNDIEDMDSDFFGIGFNYKFGSEPVVQEEVVEEVVETRPATRIVEHVYPAQTTATVQFDLESAEVKDASTLSGTVDLILNNFKVVATIRKSIRAS